MVCHLLIDFIPDHELNNVIDSLTQIFKNHCPQPDSIAENQIQANQGVGLIGEQSAPEVARKIFLNNVYLLCKKGDVDGALDLVFDKIDDYLFESNFDWCDSILREVDLSKTDVSTIISFLTTTLAARSKLPYRSEFFSRVNQFLSRDKKPEEVEKLLAGLE